jgi:iron complex transport system substrate-binding protein
MRIASLSPAATEILFALGKESQIVCVDQFSNYPEEAKSLPRLLGHQSVPVPELRRFAPDLILTATVVQEKLVAQLRAAGLPVHHDDPRTLKGVEDSIRAIGLLVEAEKEAEELIVRFREALAVVRRRGLLLHKKPRIYLEEWPTLPGSSGKHQLPFASGNWVPELVTIAGGIPYPVRAGELSKEVTLEEVRRFDPELIVISWCGAGRLADPSLLIGRPGWGELVAVQEGRIRVIDDSLLNRPGPRLAEGAARLFGWFFELLH